MSGSLVNESTVNILVQNVMGRSPCNTSRVTS